jgi:hypothetical protein
MRSRSDDDPGAARSQGAVDKLGNFVQQHCIVMVKANEMGVFPRGIEERLARCIKHVRLQVRRGKYPPVIDAFYQMCHHARGIVKYLASRSVRAGRTFQPSWKRATLLALFVDAHFFFIQCQE